MERNGGKKSDAKEWREEKCTLLSYARQTHIHHNRYCTLVQDSRIPTWDFGEIAGQSSGFSCFHAVGSHSVSGQLRSGSTGSHRHDEMTKQRVGFSSCDIRLGR
jgi:hypothetical protein